MTANDSKEPVVDQLLYAVPQAARVLGVSARLLWTFVQRGELRTRRIGVRVLIHRRELEKFARCDHEGLGKSEFARSKGGTTSRSRDHDCSQPPPRIRTSGTT